MLLARFHLPPLCKDAPHPRHSPVIVLLMSFQHAEEFPEAGGKWYRRFVCIFRAKASSWLPLAKRPWSVFRCLTAFPCLCSLHGSSMDDWRDRNRQGLCLRQYRQQTETNRLTWKCRLQREPWGTVGPCLAFLVGFSAGAWEPCWEEQKPEPLQAPSLSQRWRGNEDVL